LQHVVGAQPIPEPVVSRVLSIFSFQIPLAIAREALAIARAGRFRG
jgi:hypothetical protein